MGLQAMSEEVGMSSGCGEEGTVGGLGKDWGWQATWGRQGLGAAVAEEVVAGAARTGCRVAEMGTEGGGSAASCESLQSWEQQMDKV